MNKEEILEFVQNEVKDTIKLGIIYLATQGKFVLDFIEILAQAFIAFFQGVVDISKVFYYPIIVNPEISIYPVVGNN